jgi:hypothetical protein
MDRNYRSILKLTHYSPANATTTFFLGMYDGDLNPYVAEPAHQRFLVNRWIENKPPLTVVVNWPALLHP